MAKKVKKSSSEKWASRARRARRIRKKIQGTAERPRLCITRSNRALVAQVIDDNQGVTLVSARTPKDKAANIQLAVELGKGIAAQAQAKGIAAVVFDRGGRVFHGRVAAVAQGARDGGLKL